MFNNVTNFFNLITSRKIKSVPGNSDLIPLGTRDDRYAGKYQPSAITVDDFLASIPMPDPSINYANVVFVDRTNGDSSIAAVNKFNKPFYNYYAASLAAMSTAPTANAPALVVLRKGVYNENMLLRPNVHVYCEPGVVFTFGGFYDDASTVKSKVFGSACFYVNAVALTQKFASDIYMEFDEIIQEATTFYLAIGIVPNAGLTCYTHIKCNKIESNAKNAIVTTIRGNAFVTMDVSKRMAGPGKVIAIHPNAPSAAFTGKVIITCPEIVCDNRPTTTSPEVKSCLFNQGSLGTVEIHGDLINLSNNFVYSPGSSSQQSCVMSLQSGSSSVNRIFGNLYAGETFGIYTISSFGNDFINVDVQGNISSKSIPVCLLGHGNNVKLEGAVVKNLNNAIALPCVFANNSNTIYAKNTTFKNYNTVSSNIIALDSATAKGYFYNCVAFATTIGDVFLKNTSTGILGCVNVKSNTPIGATAATAAFTPQDFTQVTGLVLPNF